MLRGERLRIMTVRKQNNVRDNETEPWKDHGQGS